MTVTSFLLAHTNPRRNRVSIYLPVNPTQKQAISKPHLSRRLTCVNQLHYAYINTVYANYTKTNSNFGAQYFPIVN